MKLEVNKKRKAGKFTKKLSHTLFFFKFFFNVFIYFWERQRQNASGLGSEREGDTESEGGSRLRAVSTEPEEGFELMNCEIMPWAEVGSSTDWATQAPVGGTLLIINYDITNPLKADVVMVTPNLTRCFNLLPIIHLRNGNGNDNFHDFNFLQTFLTLIDSQHGRLKGFQGSN